MDLSGVIKKSQDFELIKNEIKSGKIAKSTLLFSKDNIYSFEFAKQIACLILNDGNDEENANTIKVLSYSHPDVKFYPSKEKLIVADSEEIVMESFVKPIFSHKKIFIIKNIDFSMDSAQNKLLKILEEPPENVYFILTAASENLVLPTIKSRCNKVELKKVPTKTIEEMLALNPSGKLVAQVSDGLIGKAIELSQRGDLKEIFEDTLSVITNMKSSKQVLVFSNKLMARKGSFNLIIEILSLLLEDMLLLKASKDIRFVTYREQLKNVLNEYSVQAIVEIQKSINKACKEVFYNANLNIVLENLLLNILEDKYICR